MKSKLFLLRRFALFFIAVLVPFEAPGQNGTVQFSSLAYSVKEAGSSARITLSRIGGSSGSVTVNFATSDGTAATGTDYNTTNGSLTFGPGVTSMHFQVPVLNDVEHESNETITLDLTGESVGADNNATLTILDNDSCRFSISPTSIEHGSEGGAGSFAVAATDGCDWTATENAEWIAITSGASHTGGGQVEYSCDPYQGAVSRSAVLNIAGEIFTIVQQGIFVPVGGNYNGVFHEDTARHSSSGFLTLKLTELGAFSARMNLGGKRHSFSGKFATDGHSTNIIVRPGTNLVVVLTMDFLDEQITGQITDGDWTSLLVSDRAVFHKVANPAPHAGRYTLIVRGEVENSADEPGGDSFGSVTVDGSGNAKLSGTLADGTKVTQKVSVSKNGEWPLYVPLYRGGGSIVSRVLFADESESDFSGTLIWFRPAMSLTKFYPEGIAEGQPLTGSKYQPPTNATHRVLSFHVGEVTFTAGNLPEPFTNAVNVTSISRVENLGANRMTLNIVLPTGLFNGTVTPPGATRSVPFKGALFQKGADFGAGYFLGTNQSGRVQFGAPAF